MVIYSPFFPLQNAVCFIILTYLVPVLFTFYIQVVLKFKKIIPAPKAFLLTVSSFTLFYFVAPNSTPLFISSLLIIFSGSNISVLLTVYVHCDCDVSFPPISPHTLVSSSHSRNLIGSFTSRRAHHRPHHPLCNTDWLVGRHSSWTSWPLEMGRIGSPKRRDRTTNTCCITS